MELYDGLTSPWIEALRGGLGVENAEAAANLRRLGTRALKPLLEALADDDPAQRRVAVAILGHLGNDNAAAPLLALAEGDGDMGTRSAALIAAGAIAPPDLALRFLAIAEGPERRLRSVAGWGLAQMGGRGAVTAMRGLLSRGDPSVRAFAALGLGRAGDRASAEALGGLLRSDRSVYVQAAAAWALGELRDPAYAQPLVVMLRTRTGIVAVAAAGALGKLGDEVARDALAEALFDEDPRQRRAAAQGLHDLAGEGEGAATPFAVLPQGRSAAGYVRSTVLETGPAVLGPTDLSASRDALTEAASNALRGPVERVGAALDVLRGNEDDGEGAALISLGPLTHDLAHWPSAERNAAEEELSAIALGLVPEFLRAASHPDPRIRGGVVALLARFDQPDARAAVSRALEDDEAGVQRTALASL
ncbi:MAG: HEAT repeat domain-containing protein, partial [Deltaproteobacteria bacterium]|nr:HEAT repeat domain-containing protein [Deltaproteobacteria bacterium]